MRVALYTLAKPEFDVEPGYILDLLKYVVRTSQRKRERQAVDKSVNAALPAHDKEVTLSLREYKQGYINRESNNNSQKFLRDDKDFSVMYSHPERLG